MEITMTFADWLNKQFPNAERLEALMMKAAWDAALEDTHPEAAFPEEPTPYMVRYGADAFPDFPRTSPNERRATATAVWKAMIRALKRGREEEGPSYGRRPQKDKS